MATISSRSLVPLFTRSTSVSGTFNTARSISTSVRAMSALSFPKSPVPANPLGEDRYVQSAACLIIGDEVLNGKTHDSNSNYLAKYCFDLGIDLKRIEVIPDDEEDIIEAAKRMTSKYDFVVTSGGIGPTHDDITYESIAKAFDPHHAEVAHHAETIKRMTAHLEARKARGELKEETTEAQMTARKRMALLPVKHSEALFVQEDLWVPVVRMHGRLIILPGVPKLFRALLDGMTPYLPVPPSTSKPFRLLVHTAMPESGIAPYLGELANRVKSERIRVGSYPKFQEGVDVSLIGGDKQRLEELSQEVCKQLEGKPVALEQT